MASLAPPSTPHLPFAQPTPCAPAFHQRDRSLHRGRPGSHRRGEKTRLGLPCDGNEQPETLPRPALSAHFSGHFLPNASKIRLAPTDAEGLTGRVRAVRATSEQAGGGEVEASRGYPGSPPSPNCPYTSFHIVGCWRNSWIEPQSRQGGFPPTSL